MAVCDPGTRSSLNLAFGFTFEQLYDEESLPRLDAAFLDALRQQDVSLFDTLVRMRTNTEVGRLEESELLIALAPHLDRFVGTLFGIEDEVAALRAETQALGPLHECKRLFVQRQAAKKIAPTAAAQFDGNDLRARLETRFGEPLTELAFARHVMVWEGDREANRTALDEAMAYAAWALNTPAGCAAHAGGGVLFKEPRKIDAARLVATETDTRHGVAAHVLPRPHWRERDGFGLTDSGCNREHGLDQTNYCIWCHKQGKDSCSRGLTDRKTGAFQKSAQGVALAGCPLEEKISEMQAVRAAGHAIGALAIVVVDNPMCAGTGHRICNDCMKSCIYQKQEPVNIPEVESRVLKDVLGLPWGFEIYSLLTRWNPLDIRRPVPKPTSGYKVLVAGMGPAGYTLAHHLMNDGHTVVGIDGLKIEPLPAALAGVRTSTGRRTVFEPIRDIGALSEDLDERITGGFGGVAEYGITVRWDKNNLKVIRLLLERRTRFALFGGVRLGSSVTIESAFAQGFDHVAMAMGAGRPTVIEIPNNLAKGVRQASDFLMALQLTGAAKADSIANLQVRLPIVVIGGGLTAIDTATEALTYYARQADRFLARYEALVHADGVASVRSGWTVEETEIADELLGHARALREERRAAAEAGRMPRIRALLDGWGGATIAYRRELRSSPSYSLNHEEVEKALEEGIRFADNLTPIAIEVDDHGAAQAVRFARPLGSGAAEAVLPARTVLIAAGTQPNTVIAREDPGRFGLDGKYFATMNERGDTVPAPAPAAAKSEPARVVCQLRADGRGVSFFGDMHPTFAGNVVKAMASAKLGYPVVSRLLASQPPTDVSAEQIVAGLTGELTARVYAVNRLTPTIVEVVVHAPAAARAFRPGQFYRLQNFEALSATRTHSRLAMEGLALTGASADPVRGLMSLIVLEMGGSSDLCRTLEPGEPVVLMGPTGAPTEIHPSTTVALVGGGLGNAVLFSIGRALRASGSRVLYFAGYKKLIDRYKIEEIEAAADVVVWCCDEAPGFAPSRPSDRSFIGNIVSAMEAYATGALGSTPIALRDVRHLIAIGSDRMMAAVAGARHGVLRAHLDAAHSATGSINSPMQCMMKEICGQCLQRHVDPATGKERIVFSCYDQDQPLDLVDWKVLNDRLQLNGVHEKLTARWIEHCLSTTPNSLTSPNSRAAMKPQTD